MSRSIGAQHDWENFHIEDDLAALGKRADMQGKENALDMSCRTGTLTMLVAKGSGRGQIVGLDIDDKLLTHARTKVRGDNKDRIWFVQADVTTLRPRSLATVMEGLKGGFQVVFMPGLLHRLDYDQTKQMIEAVRPYLASGVRLVIDRVSDDSRDHDVTTAGVVYNPDSREALIKLTWARRDRVVQCITELRGWATSCGLKMLTPITASIGDQRYKRIEDEIPEYFHQHIRYIRRCYGQHPDVVMRGNRTQEKRAVDLFIDMYDALRNSRQGGSGKVGEYVKNNENEFVLNIDEDQWQNGEMWAEVLKVYGRVAEVAECVKRGGTERGEIQWKVTVLAKTKRYRAHGVFELQEESNDEGSD